MLHPVIREFLIASWQKLDDFCQNPTASKKQKLSNVRAFEKEQRMLKDAVKAERDEAQKEINRQLQQAHFMNSTVPCKICEQGRMVTKVKQRYPGMDFVVFFFGVFVIVFLGCTGIGLILGIIFCIVGLCLGHVKRPVWQCASCGTTVERG